MLVPSLNEFQFGTHAATLVDDLMREPLVQPRRELGAAAPPPPPERGSIRLPSAFRLPSSSSSSSSSLPLITSALPNSSQIKTGGTAGIARLVAGE